MGITARFLQNLARGFQTHRYLVDKWCTNCIIRVHAAIETEFETLRATPDFARRVCHILRNRCLACIAEGSSEFEHKM